MRYSYLLWAPAVSIFNVPFTRRNSLLLSAVARANGYSGEVWIAEQMWAALNLHVLSNAPPSVQLEAANGRCLYQHASQFAESLEEIRARLKTERDRLRPLQGASDRTREALSHTQVLAAPVRDATATPLPLSTNGEPFYADVTGRMVAYMDSNTLHCGRSPYWATANEAAYIFQSPFHEAFLADRRNAVTVPFPLAPETEPLLYFHVSGTRRPEVFTPSMCRRYDPYNFCGAFYTPMTAIRMKRYVVQHDCVNEPRWVTLWRVRKAGANLRPGASPLGFATENGMLWLANVAATTHPRLVESVCVQSSSGTVVHTAEDSSLLIRSHKTEEYDDAVDTDTDPTINS